MARSHSRVRNWGTIGAFTLIVAITIGEGVDEGFSFWDWLVIGCGVRKLDQNPLAAHRRS
jgi:hypothetical protein